MAASDDAARCMKCGFCMSSCPVYSIDHIESHVARGRNVLVRLAKEGDIAADKSYADRLSYCLLCGRCEASCPAKVQSADITVAARSSIVNKVGLSLPKRLIYRGVLNNPKLMACLLGVTAALPGMSTKDGKPLRHLPDFASVFTGGLSVPALSRPFLSRRLGQQISPPKGIKVHGQVAFFPGCAFEYFLADAGESIALGLAKAGFEVVYPRGLTCCGLPVRAAGDLTTAQDMARRNIAALNSFDHVVTGCATCHSALSDYKKWFPDDSPWHEKAGQLSAKMTDMSQLLVKSGFTVKRPERITVTYHDPCHSKWHLGISDEPRRLLESIEGVEFREMEGADDCCGLGGAFAIDHREISLALQTRKMQSIARTGAEAVVTSCPGCLIQLMDGVRRHKLPVKVMHISQLVHEQKGPRRTRR
jgi:glycolate oxidase iron-sulfur subunit